MYVHVAVVGLGREREGGGRGRGTVYQARVFLDQVFAHTCM